MDDDYDDIDDLDVGDFGEAAMREELLALVTQRINSYCYSDVANHALSVKRQVAQGKTLTLDPDGR